jgi:hypothetical protein
MAQQQEDDKQKEVEAIQPKPTDSPQLDIETVTPDTQATVPDTPVESNKTEAAKPNSQTSNTANRNEVASDEQGREQVPEDSTNSDATDNGEDDDIRDQIETIAP